MNANSISIQGNDLHTTLDANANPEIWTASNNTYQRLNKLYFSNFQYPLPYGLISSNEGFGAYEFKAIPNIDDIVYSYAGKRNTTSYVSITRVWNES